MALISANPLTMNSETLVPDPNINSTSINSWNDSKIMTMTITTLVGDETLGFGIPDTPLAIQIVNYCFGVILVIIGLAGSCGNGMVLVVFLKYRRLRGGSSPLILNLATGDFVVSLLHILPAYSSFAEEWQFGNMGCSIYAASVGVCGISSILTLSVISAEKFCTILGRPVKFLAVKKTCLAIWLMSLFLILPPFFGYSRFCLEGMNTSCSWDYTSRTVKNRQYYIFLILLGFVLPISIIIVSYIGILLLVMQQSGQTREISQTAIQNAGGGGGGTGGANSNCKNKSPTKNDIKTAKVIFTVILCFLLSWTPYALVTFIGQFGDLNYLSRMGKSVPAIFAKASVIFNPIIYSLSHPQFRSAMRTLYARNFNRYRKYRHHHQPTYLHNNNNDGTLNQKWNGNGNTYYPTSNRQHVMSKKQLKCHLDGGGATAVTGTTGSGETGRLRRDVRSTRQRGAWPLNGSVKLFTTTENFTTGNGTIAPIANNNTYNKDGNRIIGGASFSHCQPRRKSSSNCGKRSYANITQIIEDASLLQSHVLIQQKARNSLPGHDILSVAKIISTGTFKFKENGIYHPEPKSNHNSAPNLVSVSSAFRINSERRNSSPLIYKGHSRRKNSSATLRKSGAVNMKYQDHEYDSGHSSSLSQTHSLGSASSHRCDQQCCEQSHQYYTKDSSVQLTPDEYATAESLPLDIGRKSTSNNSCSCTLNSCKKLHAVEHISEFEDDDVFLHPRRHSFLLPITAPISSPVSSMNIGSQIGRTKKAKSKSSQETLGRNLHSQNSKKLAHSLITSSKQRHETSNSSVSSILSPSTHQNDKLPQHETKTMGYFLPGTDKDKENNSTLVSSHSDGFRENNASSQQQHQQQLFNFNQVDHQKVTKLSRQLQREAALQLYLKLVSKKVPLKCRNGTTRRMKMMAKESARERFIYPSKDLTNQVTETSLEEPLSLRHGTVYSSSQHMFRCESSDSQLDFYSSFI